MPSIRDLKSRLNSLHNTQKITGAMNLIASTRLRRQLPGLGALITFDETLEHQVAGMREALSDQLHPLLQGGCGKGPALHVIAISADKGLCGGHNSAIQLTLARLLLETPGTEVTVIGRKLGNFCRRKQIQVFRQVNSGDRDLGKEALRSLTRELMDHFLQAPPARVCLVFNRFVSTLAQEPRTQTLFPLHATARGEAQLVPNLSESVVVMLRTYLFFNLQAALHHSRLSENAARMTAMENASSNAQDLIDRYQSIRNRVRQAAITRDLTEIAAGKEALDQ